MGPRKIVCDISIFLTFGKGDAGCSVEWLPVSVFKENPELYASLLEASGSIRGLIPPGGTGVFLFPSRLPSSLYPEALEV